jgi:SAM-dependent methyltransferase
MKKGLGQFFTPHPFADLLVAGINKNKKKILDLGCGDGRLGISALHQNKNGFYVGVERDNLQAEIASSNLENYGYRKLIFNDDALSEKLEGKLIELGEFDLALGNPPYLTHPNKDEFQNIVEKVFPGLTLSPNSFRMELIFLARSISHLKPGGSFSFILPKYLFSSERYKSFRELLLDTVSRVQVIELPDRIFDGAEVSTCMLKGEVGKRARKITLAKANNSARIIEKVIISRKEAIGRMDFSYHQMMRKMGIDFDEKLPTLRTLGVELKRGSRSRSKFIEQSLSHFHTVDFPKSSDFISFDSEMKECYVTARGGDILVPRVGARILDRQVMVENGEKAITDCVYRLRAPNNIAGKVFELLQSEIGKKWRIANSRGSCAKYITNDSLLSLPIV